MRNSYGRRVSATEILGLLVLYLGLLVLIGGLGFLADIIGAQLVVWGLSMDHVHSGIWGPYWILMGVSMVVTTSVAVNNAVASKR